MPWALFILSRNALFAFTPIGLTTTIFRVKAVCTGLTDLRAVCGTVIADRWLSVGAGTHICDTLCALEMKALITALTPMLAEG